MDPQEYDDIIRNLARIAAHQETINADVRAMLTNHDLLLRQQVEINADVRTTLARLETLMEEVFRERHNGRDA